MKHLKTFEKLEEWNKETGSYVVMTDPNNNNRAKRIRKFLENNVGVITKMYYPGAWFDVKYDNLPEVIKSKLNSQLHQQDILFISKNKKDAEEYIERSKNVKKYNL